MSKQVLYFVFILSPFLVTGQCSVLANNLNLKAEFANSKLPLKIYFTQSIYDGNISIYLLGGVTTGGVRRTEIFRYDIVSDSIEDVGRLPVGVRHGTAQWVDNNIYYFGARREGNPPSHSNSDVVKFDPRTNTATSVATLPTEAQDIQASFKHPNSALVYVFMFETGELFECDMSTYTIRTLPDKIKAKAMTSVVVNNNAYIFYGSEKKVLKIDMVSLEMELIINTPQFNGRSFAVSDGLYAYMIGGQDLASGVMADFLLRFNPANQDWTSIAVDNFPYNGDVGYYDGPSSVYVDKLNRIYYFGGAIDHKTWNQFTYLDDIWYIDLNPLASTESPSNHNFACMNKADGMYSHPSDCSKFVWCDAGVSAQLECPPNLLFDPVTCRCDHAENVVCEVGCTGKPDGHFPYSNNCSMFILCHEEVLSVHHCPIPLLFDPALSMCNAPSFVNCSIFK